MLTKLQGFLKNVRRVFVKLRAMPIQTRRFIEPSRHVLENFEYNFTRKCYDIPLAKNASRSIQRIKDDIFALSNPFRL